MPKLSWSRKKCPYCSSFVKEDAAYCPKCNKPLLVLGNADVGQVYDNLLIEKSRKTVQNWLNLHHSILRKDQKEKFQNLIHDVNEEMMIKDAYDRTLMRWFFNSIGNEYDDISGVADEIDLESEPISSQDFSNIDQLSSQAPGKISSLLAKAKEIGAAKMLAYLGIIGNAARLMLPSLLSGLPKEIRLQGSGRPEAIIGGVPIYNIQRKERARSDRKVKYRAIGDVFLAHQKGTEDSLRIDGRLIGPLRYLYLWSLITLQQKGETRLDKITSSKLGLEFIGDNLPSESLEEIKETAQNKEVNYEFHHTFPIITRFAIMFDMYLQTIEWHRTLESGKETIEFSLLFRKWIPNTGYKVFNPKFDEDGNLKGTLKLQLLTEDRFKWTKYLIDAIWKGIWIAGEICPRLIFGIEEESIRELDREAWTEIGKLVKSYNATKFLGKNFFNKTKFLTSLVA